MHYYTINWLNRSSHERASLPKAYTIIGINFSNFNTLIQYKNYLDSRVTYLLRFFPGNLDSGGMIDFAYIRDTNDKNASRFI